MLADILFRLTPAVRPAAATISVPITISFTLDSIHRLQSGPTLKEAVEVTDAEAGDAKPDFYGINCSHPVEFKPALEPDDWVRRLRSLRPNAAKMDKVSLCSLGHIEEGDPEELGQLIWAVLPAVTRTSTSGAVAAVHGDKYFDAIARHVRPTS